MFMSDLKSVKTVKTEASLVILEQTMLSPRGEAAFLQLLYVSESDLWLMSHITEFNITP